MVEDASTEKERIREWIREQLKKVPASVNGGSHQAAVHFKKFHADATKAITSTKTSAEKLRGLRVQVMNLYHGRPT